MERTQTARERLLEWVERGKINQLEASRIIGMDPTQLSQILTGKRTPGLANAIKIEKATGIQPDAWVPISEDEEAETSSVRPRKAQISK